MVQKPGTEQDNKQFWLNLTLAGAAGQVGCVTLIIVIVAVLLGLWLDAQFNTKPVFTLVLLVGSIPVSLVTMLYLARFIVSKIKAGPGGVQTDDQSQEPPQA